MQRGVPRGLVTGLLYLLKVLVFMLTGVAAAGAVWFLYYPQGGGCGVGPLSIVNIATCGILDLYTRGLLTAVPSTGALAFCSVYLHTRTGKGSAKEVTAAAGIMLGIVGFFLTLILYAAISSI